MELTHISSRQRMLSWYSALSQERQFDLKICSIGTALTLGGVILYRYFKKEENNTNNPKISLFPPLSGNKIFWGSYLMSSCTYLLTFSSRCSIFFEKYIPRIMTTKFIKSKFIKSKLMKPMTDSLPPLPQIFSIVSAFKLGKFEQSLIYLESLPDDQTNAINEILHNATKLLHHNSTITSAQLHGIADRMVKPTKISASHHATQSGRDLSEIFKFVNIMWGLSIFGISITVIPVIYKFGKPIWIEIYNFFKKFLIKTGQILYALLFNPFSYTIYEMMGYFCCWYFIFLGSEKNGDANIAFFTSLTGLALWCPLYSISFMRHKKTDNFDQIEFESMTALIISLLTAPIAYKFNYKLLIISVVSFYKYLIDRIGIPITTLLHTVFAAGLSYKYNSKPLAIVAVAGLYPYLISFSTKSMTQLIMTASIGFIANRFNDKILALISVGALYPYFKAKRVRLSISCFVMSTLTAFISYKYKWKQSGFVGVGGLYFAMYQELIGNNFHARSNKMDLIKAGIVSSSIFNVGLISLKLTGVNTEKYAMLILPSCLVGCIGMYSSLLLFASANMDNLGYINIKYWKRQCIMIAALIFGVGTGKILQFPAMNNTAYLFSVFYVLWKMGESQVLWKEKNMIYSIFASSVVTWRVALYLHKNPGVVQKTLANTTKFE